MIVSERATVPSHMPISAMMTETTVVRMMSLFQR